MSLFRSELPESGDSECSEEQSESVLLKENLETLV